MVDKKAEIFTLHRYFIWADRMRVHLDALFLNDLKNAELDILLYMSYWYGALYVVIEDWHKLKLSDTRIDLLLDSPNVDLLRRYRNGVFHFQQQYFDPRLSDFFGESSTAFWIRELRNEFSRWFLDWFEKNENE